jgi:hypothetical protein
MGSSWDRSEHADGSPLYRDQYYDLVARQRVLEGERALMFAVLLDGIACYLINQHPRTPERRRCYEEAWRWMSSSDEDGVFSFVQLCGAFDVDSTALRTALKRISGGRGKHLLNGLGRKKCGVRSATRLIGISRTSVNPMRAKNSLSGAQRTCPRTNI